MRRVSRNVAALRDALNLQGSSHACLRLLNEAEWKDLLRFCDLMKLTLILGRVAEDALPTWVRSRIAQNLMDNRQRFERTATAYKEIAAVFHDRALEHLVLKGFAQWGSLIHPRDRMQGDIDLYCPSGSVDAAQEALRALGYEPLRGFDDSPSDHFPAMTRKNHWKWKGDYFDPEIPVSVDLHYRLWDHVRAGFGPPGLEDFWERRVVRRLETFSFPAFRE